MSTDTTAKYDVIVVGSGVAGLYTAVELLREFPKLRLAVYELEKDVGGRAKTSHQKVEGVALQWEAGAGRISDRHTHVLGLLKRYKLKWNPIGGDSQFKGGVAQDLEPNVFEAGIPIMLDTLAGLPAEELAQHTIKQLLTRIHGPVRTEKYLIRFPYRAELEVMRADKALELFAHEMGGATAGERFGICAGGLSAMTAAMRREAERRGATFFFEHKLIDFKDGEATFQPMEGGVEAEEKIVRAAHMVLALPSVALAKLKALRGWRTLRHLRMTPLLRFYGVFPKDAGGGMWYDEFGGRVVTAGRVRYMIPGYAPPAGSVGSAQISYTDTQDAEVWMRRIEERGERATGMEIVDELREWLKPTIPTPLFLRAHVWPAGVTYWLPGSYSAEEESRAAVHPMPDKYPGLWICGESFSLRQAWMEGALEHTALMLAPLKRALKKKHAR